MKVTPAIREQVVELRQRPLKVRDVALRVGLGIRTVERILQRAGVYRPADRFYCGHPKSLDNLRSQGPGKAPSCRICRNEQQLAFWYRKQGRSPLRLERAWSVSRITNHGRAEQCA